MRARVVKSQTTRSRTLKLDGVIRMNAKSDLPISPWHRDIAVCRQSISGSSALSGLCGLWSLGPPNVVFPICIIVK